MGGPCAKQPRRDGAVARGARAIVGRPLSGFLCGEERVRFLTRVVGMLAGGGLTPQTWQARLQPAEGAAVAAELTVRAIPLRKSAIGGLCWLIRPVG